MNVLELFAGSRSIGNVAEELGMNVFSSDINAFDKIDYVVDILNFDIKKIPFEKVDIIWASPPCTFFSVASIGHHWNKNNTPKSENALIGVAIVKKTIEIIEALNPTYFFIENPRGKLRKLKTVWDNKVLDRATVTYCSYGDSRMKPTDIWTNNKRSMYNPGGWQPRNICWNGNKKCHHENAPRGSKTGTQGLDNDYERSKLPRELCLEILNSCKNK